MIYYICITYNHIFCKLGFDRLFPARKFAQDLKDNHDHHDSFNFLQR